MAYRLLRREGAPPGLHLLFSVGVALVCGAYTSLRGDDAWTPKSLFDWDTHSVGERARSLSVSIGIMGCLLLAVPVMYVFSRAGLAESNPSFDPLRILSAAVPSLFLVHALRSGDWIWQGGRFDRNQTPLLFWILVICDLVAVLMILFVR